MPVPIGTAVFQWTTVAGLPAVGYKLYSYVAGSTTPLATYPTSGDAGAGTNPNTNPTILDSLGSAIIWIPDGTTYKFVLTDTLGSTVWTVDNVSSTSGGTGGGGVSGEWVASGMTPTFINSTSFSVTGDQRATFDVSRKLKSTVTAGTSYSTIVSSSFSTVTTVTVVVDQGSIGLDSGLSAVSYGGDGVNRSIPTASSMYITGGSPGAMTTTVYSTQMVTAASPTVQIDVLSEFTASNGRFTAKNAGLYRSFALANLTSSGVTFSGAKRHRIYQEW